MKQFFLRRGRSALAAVLSVTLVGLGILSLPFLASPAYAVSGTTGPVNVTVTPTTGLVSGQNIAIDATATTGTMSDILVHVCDSSILPVNQFKFTSDVYCPNVTLTGGDTSNNVDKTLANTTTGHVDFKVGTGHAHWIDGFNPSPPANTHDLTCDVTNSCLLVMQYSSNVAPGTFYFSTPLTYAGTPGAPTLTTATGGSGSIAAAWTAPANTGNGTIDQYTVTATKTGGPTADPTSPHQVTVAAPTTNATIPGLVNFDTYSVTVNARITAADGTTHFTSVESNLLSATPGPAGPSNVSGTPANTAVNLTWTPPSFITGLTSYRVTTFTEPGHVQVAQTDTGSTSAAFQVTGLTNGTQYSFTVAANYGGTFSADSAPSSTIVPNGKFITQTITVTRPQGDLVLTQACAPVDALNPTPTNPYPVDVNGVPNPEYPTNCGINLGKATLITTGAQAGQYFQATGDLNPVSVVDTRDADPGWTATAAASAFTDGLGNHFSGDDLGIVPLAIDNSAPFVSPDGPYAQTVAAGPTVAPGTIGGLSTARTLAKAGAAIGTIPANTGGLGLAHLGGHLSLLIPVFIHHGNYTATLTITAI